MTTLPSQLTNQPYQPPQQPTNQPAGNINYDWDYFLVASGFSVVGMAIWISIAWVLNKAFGIEGPGISGALRAVFVKMHAGHVFDKITGEWSGRGNRYWWWCGLSASGV